MLLVRTTQSRSMTRRATNPDEENDRTQEAGSHNDTAPSLQEQDQVESEPSTFTSILQDEKGSNQTISDQVTPSRTLLVPTTNNSILPPSTVPPPTPNSTAGNIHQNLGNESQ